ncbi:Fur family transcriptional regulator [Actibacterium sp.]|uniref:Fur family transcriptional regulator n=1 Tax=Actibacterium sp. TaxID=1872125 RepID=UPI003562F77C
MPASPVAFAKHDHSACSGDILKQADALARTEGLRLTPVRRRTLEILLESHQALGAYEVLERLAEDGFGHQPPVAYRALEFLVEHGLVHRIRRLNAFAACMHPGSPHRPVFFICTGCDTVAEAPGTGVGEAITRAATTVGFSVERMNVEAVGLCPACQECTA